MALAFTPGTDFEDICDGLEAVTLNRRGSSSNDSVSHALQRAVSTAEVEASDGRYLSGDVRWHLPVAECANRPTPGDDIVDGASDRWKVLDVQEATLSRRWRCVCRNLSVTFGLNDTLRIEQAVYSKDTGGAATETPHVLRTGVRARIQPVAVDVETVAGAKRSEQTFEIYLGEDLEDADVVRLHTLLFVASDGTKYRPTAYRAAERIGELAFIEAEIEHG